MERKFLTRAALAHKSSIEGPAGKYLSFKVFFRSANSLNDRIATKIQIIQKLFLGCGTKHLYNS